MRIFQQILNNLAILGPISILFLLLSACTTQTTAENVLASPTKPEACTECERETLIAAMDQEQKDTDIHTVATAERLLANAQSTLNSANATVNAVQTQEQNNADVIAAQIEATTILARAHAQATLVASGSTQSAAMTQDLIQQTQVQYNLRVAEDMATQNAIAIATQQQMEMKRQAPITFLWMWCPPSFILLFAGLVLWGIWRWIKIQQANSLPDRDRYSLKSRYQFTKPAREQTIQFLAEIKRKMLRNGRKD